MAILNEAGSKRLSVKAWGTEQVIPRAELLKEVKGVHGILCTICDKIDKEVLDAAGKNSPLLLLSFVRAFNQRVDYSGACNWGVFAVVRTGVAKHFFFFFFF